MISDLFILNLSLVFSFFSSPEIPYIPERKAVIEIFPEEECKNEINWLSHSDTFPKFTQMLNLPSYTESLLLGLIASVGGLTESLVSDLL